MRDRDEMSIGDQSESLSSSSHHSSPSNIRLDLQEEDNRLQPETMGNQRQRGRSMMDVEERTRSLTQSYFETEKEEEYYNN